MNELRFDGLVAVITGAGRGLGRHYARLLSARGARVVVNDHGGPVTGGEASDAAAHAVADEITADGGEAVADTHTVATPAGGQAIIDTALNRWGRVDIVVNNAGIVDDCTFEEMTDDRLSPLLDVHLKGAFFVTRPAWKVMRENGFGRVVNTCSAAGLLGAERMSNYGAAKTGLVGLTRVLAAEGAEFGIKVNAVAPIAATRMLDYSMNSVAELTDPAAAAAAEEAMRPFRGRLDPALVAPVVAFLAHPDCPVSGGDLHRRRRSCRPLLHRPDPGLPQPCAVGGRRLHPLRRDPRSDALHRPRRPRRRDDRTVHRHRRRVVRRTCRPVHWTNAAAPTTKDSQRSGVGGGLRLRHDARTPVLIALILTMALVAMDTTILATAVPQVVGDLGGFDQVGWVFSIYLLAQTVTIPIYGKLADLYGRKPILIVGVVVFMIGSALSAASWNMLTLTIFRAIQGLGAGAISATVQTVAGDLYSVAERGRIQGYLSSVWGISAIIAPALGGMFAQYLTWRWIFLVNIPIGIVALYLIVRDLHEDVVRRPHRIDYLGAGLVLVSAGLFILGLLSGGVNWAWTSPTSILVFTVAALAGVALLVVEYRASEPVLPIWLLTRRLTAASFAATATAGMLVMGLSVYLPNWGQTVLGLSPIAAGFVLAIMSITWPVASGFSARLYLRIGFRDTALVGAITAVAAASGLALLGPDAAVWQPVLFAGLLGVGMGWLFSPLIVGLQNTVGWEQRGTVTGGLMFSRFLGQSIGAAGFGAVANSVLRRYEGAPTEVAMHAASHAVFVGLLVAAVVTVALLLVVPRKFPIHRTTPAD
ncbi:MDR family MFS transporter [Mycolicibacterium thermoresistibile]